MFRCCPRPRTLRIPPTQWVAFVRQRGSTRGIKLAVLAQLPEAIRYTGSQENTGIAQLQYLRTQGVGPANLAHQLGKLKKYQLTIKVAPQHTVSHNEMRYFGHRAHCWSQSVMRRYLSWKDKPLWRTTSVLVGEQDFKAIVRGAAKYRINAAMNQALRNAGYDNDGRRLSKEALEKQAALLGVSRVVHAKMDGIGQLYGSMEIIVRDALLINQTPFEKLRRYLDDVVLALEREIGRRADFTFGRSSTPTRAQTLQNTARKNTKKWKQN